MKLSLLSIQFLGERDKEKVHILTCRLMNEINYLKYCAMKIF